MEGNLETMEKSWNDSRDYLLSLLNGNETDLTKSKSKQEKQAKLDLDDDESEDNNEEESEEDEKKVKKSLDDMVSANSEAEAAMDVEPFLRELVKSLNEKFDEINKKINNLTKSVASIETLSKAQAKLALASADLQKAMSDTVEKIGDTPVPSGSVLSKSMETRFAHGNGKKEYTKQEILTKALELRKSGKLGILDVTKIEGRINKGIPLGEYEKYFERVEN